MSKAGFIQSIVLIFMAILLQGCASLLNGIDTNCASAQQHPFYLTVEQAIDTGAADRYDWIMPYSQGASELF